MYGDEIWSNHAIDISMAYLGIIVSWRVKEKLVAVHTQIVLLIGGSNGHYHLVGLNN